MTNLVPSRLRWEEEFWLQGCRLVAGLDEAGRGPLAGPVVAAAVILPPEFEESLPVIDSKRLSPSRREQVFGFLAGWEGIAVGIGRVDAPRIDEINILQATREAMLLAVSALPTKPQALLIDALQLAETGLPQKKFYHGEDESISIAAASIVAKVTRDRIMCSYHKIYPDYGFDRHKGYGTKAHLDALAKLGPTPIHRRSFRPVRENS